jgi:hypothetical protein
MQLDTRKVQQGTNNGGNQDQSGRERDRDQIAALTAIPGPARGDDRGRRRRDARLGCHIRHHDRRRRLDSCLDTHVIIP